MDDLRTTGVAETARMIADDGLPVAVQLVGRTDEEATLFSLAAQLEQARPWPIVAI